VTVILTGTLAVLKRAPYNGGQSSGLSQVPQLQPIPSRKLMIYSSLRKIRSCFAQDLCQYQKARYG